MSEIIGLRGMKQEKIDNLLIHSDDPIGVDWTTTVDAAGLRTEDFKLFLLKTREGEEAKEVAFTVNAKLATRLAKVTAALALLQESVTKVEAASSGISTKPGCCTNCDTHRELFARNKEIDEGSDIALVQQGAIGSYCLMVKTVNGWVPVQGVEPEYDPDQVCTVTADERLQAVKEELEARLLACRARSPQQLFMEQILDKFWPKR